MNIQLKQLTLFNFRSYVGKHTIDLPESGLMLIDGEKSGVGKSNIIGALAYALEFPNYTVKETQTWVTEDPFYVELLLSIDNKNLLIHKGPKQTGVWFELEGQDRVTGMVEQVSEKLELLLKTNSIIRKALTYRPQRTPGLFLSMVDAEKKEFLTGLLGIDWIEDEIEKLTKTAAKIQVDLNVNELRVNDAKKKLENETGKLEEPTIDVEEIDNNIIELINDIEKIEIDYNNYNDKLTVIENDINGQLKAINKEYESGAIEVEIDNTFLNNLIKEYKEIEVVLTNLKNNKLSTSDDYSIEIKKKEEEITKINGQTNTLDRLNTKKNDLLNENKRIEQNLCPKCNQNLPADSTMLLLNNTAIEQLNKEIERIELVISPLPELKTNLENIKQEYDAMNNGFLIEIQDYNDQLSTLKEKILNENSNLTLKKNHLILESKNKKNELELEVRKEFKEMTDLINSKKVELALSINEHKEMLNDFRSHRQTWEYQKEKHANQLLMIEKCQKELKIIENKFNEVNDKLNLEKECKLVLKGFLDNIFEEIMQELSQETNNILLYLSNVNHVTINFNIDRITSKGSTRFVINPVIYFNGVERSLKNASGGMMTSIELAVDMALANIIAKRSGVNFNFMMLDEAFDGHDSATKEGCLEMFAKYSSNKLFLIIDHSIEMKELFDKTLYVTMVNGQSQISQ